MTYALCSTVGVTLGSTNPQNVDGAAVAAEKAPIVEAISVDPSKETLRGAYGELHAFLVACLGNCKGQLVIVNCEQQLRSLRSVTIHALAIAASNAALIEIVVGGVKRSRIVYV